MIKVGEVTAALSKAPNLGYLCQNMPFIFFTLFSLFSPKYVAGRVSPMQRQHELSYSPPCQDAISVCATVLVRRRRKKQAELELIDSVND